MIHWPATGTRRIEAEPVGLANTAPDGNVPTLSPVDPETGSARAPMRGRRRAGWTALAIALSTAVHAAALVLLADKVTRNGVEAADDPVSVEIVLEGPVATARAPVAGAEAQGPRDAAETVAPVETAERETAPAEPVTVTPSETAREMATTEPAEAEAAKPAETAQVNPTARQPVTADTHAPAADAAEVEPMEEPVAVALPTVSIPLPTPRPEPPARRTAAPAPAKPAKASARTSESEPVRHVKAAPSGKRKAPLQSKASVRGQPAQADRTGGATAGEKAAYARRLMRHVERYKRYPRAAERQGITGDAGLSITIDRAGGLASARLARGSGHSVLDDEALAVARRAAPYPRPPEGIGGSTVTFAVTLRFSR